MSTDVHLRGILRIDDPAHRVGAREIGDLTPGCPTIVAYRRALVAAHHHLLGARWIYRQRVKVPAYERPLNGVGATRLGAARSNAYAATATAIVNTAITGSNSEDSRTSWFTFFPIFAFKSWSLCIGSSEPASVRWRTLRGMVAISCEEAVKTA